MAVDGVRVGIDFGTSSTAAVLAGPGTQTRPLLFDGSPLLASAVFADADGGLLTGRDALHSARTQPERFESAPKRCVDHGTVLLGDRVVPVVELIAAVLCRVAAEADQVAGERVRQAVLSHPASWGPVRRQTLLVAASEVFAEPALVTEPVAAASYFLTVAGRELPVGSTAMVYDLGAGTFDATVVRRTADGFEVLATDGLDDVGGLDIDAALVGSLGEVYRSRDGAAWSRLLQPASAADRRAARSFWDDVRVGKELLSRAPTALLHVPIVDDEALLGREQLEQLAEPILDRTVSMAVRVLTTAGVTPGELAELFLVGGASRMPLVGTLLHRRLGVPPMLVDQPELVVASGSPHAPLPARAEPPIRVASVPPIRVASVPPIRIASVPPPSTLSFPSIVEGRSEPPPAPVGAPAVEPILAIPLVDDAALDGTAATASPPPGPVTASASGDRWRLALVAAAVVVLALLGYAVWNLKPWDPSGGDRSAGTPSVDPTGSASPTASPRPVAPQPQMLRVPVDFKANSVVLSPDGTRLAAIGTYAIRTYSVPELRLVGKQITVGKETYQPPGGLGPVSREDFEEAAFSSNGRLLATYDSGTFGYVQVWDVATGKRLKRLSDAWWASCLAFSPRGDQFVACAGHDESVRFWSVSGWSRGGRVDSDDPAAIRHVAFSPDGKLLATDGGKGRVLLWDARSRRRLAVLPASTFPAGVVPAGDPGVSVAFSPDGRTLATGGIDGTVRLWNVGNRRQIAVLGQHPGTVVEVAFARDGTLASSGADRSVRLWEVATRQQVGAAGFAADLGDAATDMIFSPDSRTVSVCVADTVLRWDVAALRAYAASASPGPGGS